MASQSLCFRIELPNLVCYIEETPYAPTLLLWALSIRFVLLQRLMVLCLDREKLKVSLNSGQDYLHMTAAALGGGCTKHQRRANCIFDSTMLLFTDSHIHNSFLQLIALNTLLR